MQESLIIIQEYHQTIVPNCSAVKVATLDFCNNELIMFARYAANLCVDPF